MLLSHSDDALLPIGRQSSSVGVEGKLQLLLDDVVALESLVVFEEMLLFPSDDALTAPESSVFEASLVSPRPRLVRPARPRVVHWIAQRLVPDCSPLLLRLS